MTPIEFTYEEYLCNAKVTTRGGNEVIYVFENEKDCLGLTYIAKYNDKYYHMDCYMDGRTDLSEISDHDLVITERGLVKICTNNGPGTALTITFKSFADINEDDKKQIRKRVKNSFTIDGIKIPFLGLVK